MANNNKVEGEEHGSYRKPGMNKGASEGKWVSVSYVAPDILLIGVHKQVNNDIHLQ